MPSSSDTYRLLLQIAYGVHASCESLTSGFNSHRAVSRTIIRPYGQLSTGISYPTTWSRKKAPDHLGMARLKSCCSAICYQTPDNMAPGITEVNSVSRESYAVWMSAYGRI